MIACLRKARGEGSKCHQLRHHSGGEKAPSNQGSRGEGLEGTPEVSTNPGSSVKELGLPNLQGKALQAGGVACDSFPNKPRDGEEGEEKFLHCVY